MSTFGVVIDVLSTSTTDDTSERAEGVDPASHFVAYPVYPLFGRMD
jgi:hypothetical protein